MKIYGALHSDFASGSLPGCITFSVRDSGQQCRFQRKQRDRVTPLREAQRDKFKIACDLFKAAGFGKMQCGVALFGGLKVRRYLRPGAKGGTNFSFFISDIIKRL